MTSMDTRAIFGIVSGLLWLGLIIFQLVISLSAQKKYPGKASSMMVVGSIGGVLLALANRVMPFLLDIMGLSIDSLSMLYGVAGIIASIFGLVFLIGLYQLINEQFNAKDQITRHLM